MTDALHLQRNGKTTNCKAEQEVCMEYFHNYFGVNYILLSFPRIFFHNDTYLHYLARQTACSESLKAYVPCIAQRVAFVRIFCIY